VCFATLIKGDLHYFLQDDNYVQFSPVITQNLEDFYEHGQSPNYNFYQNAGIPTMSYSIYSLTYPLTHIAFLISKYIMGNSTYFMFVFVFIHFLVGFIFFLKILELFKIQYIWALMAVCCFIFSGFNVYVSRSWYFVTPSIAFVPLLTYLRLKWTTTFSIKKIFLFAFLLSLYAYSGNFQFWIYSICLWIVVELCFINKQTLKYRGLFFIFTLGIALVLFIPQLYATIKETSGLDRNGGSGVELGPALNEMIFPFHYNDDFNGKSGGGSFSKYNWVHAKNNGLLALISFSCLFYMLLLKNKIDKKIKILCSILFLCVIYACGRWGFLYPLIGKLPVFNKFFHPFKF
jgi:hypothetical protein